MAVAAAFVIGSYLLLPLNLYLQHRYAGISIYDHLWQLRWIALCTAIMAAAVIAVQVRPDRPGAPGLGCCWRSR